MRAIVDIGPMKTGSSARARYLQFAQAGGLLPPGVLYPTGDLWFGKGRQTVELKRLAHASTQNQTRSDEKSEVQRALDRVQAVALEQHGADATVVFVGETISHHPDTQWAWDEFTSRFDSSTFILNARRQDSAISSLIAQRVKMASSAYWSLDLADQIAEKPLTFKLYDYMRHLTRWEPPTANAELKAIPIFERNEDPYRTVANFFTAVGWGAPPAIKQFEDDVFNKSPSPEFMQKLSAAKRRATNWENVPAETSMYRDRVNKILKRANRDTASGSWKLAASDRLEVLRHFRDSNESLISRHVADESLGHEWRSWGAALAETIAQLEAPAAEV